MIIFAQTDTGLTAAVWPLIGISAPIAASIIGATWILSQKIGKKQDKDTCEARQTACDVKHTSLQEQLSNGDKCMGRLDERVKTLTRQNERQAEITRAQERVLTRLETLVDKNGHGPSGPGGG